MKSLSRQPISALSRFGLRWLPNDVIMVEFTAIGVIGTSLEVIPVYCIIADQENIRNSKIACHQANVLMKLAINKWRAAIAPFLREANLFLYKRKGFGSVKSKNICVCMCLCGNKLFLHEDRFFYMCMYMRVCSCGVGECVGIWDPAFTFLSHTKEKGIRMFICACVRVSVLICANQRACMSA